MLRSILVGLDGSAYSHTALEFCIDWARRYDALIVGLGIIAEPAIRAPEMTPIGAGAFKQHADEIRLAQATRQVEQFLEQFSLRCADAAVASKVLEDVGEPYEQILREAQRYDVIVLGQQTYFHFATHEGPCETLKKVLNYAPRPVITVPEKLVPGSSILIAYDGSLQAARVLQAFQGIGVDDASELHVVSVGSNYVEASRLSDRAIEYLALHGRNAKAHVVSSSDTPAAVILDLARRVTARLVVMGAYGQSAIKEFFLGSVTRTMLKESSVPLFLYH